MSLSLMCSIQYSQTEVCHTDAWSPNDLYKKLFQKTEKTSGSHLCFRESQLLRRGKASDLEMLSGQKSCLSQALSSLGMVKLEFY